ncbi:MAG TPA: glycine betaine ABC transporter substrate-binding protein [Candidatus Acidoferrales bacterium]|jgi:glycine betaine/choline ABC-type transport system substrate-binding protein|nr:glycine betaine ABC transporter substrate-binding protein [Candidatus Acidoferrales bacterium]
MSDSPGCIVLKSKGPRFKVSALFLGAFVSLFAAGCKKQDGGKAIVVGSKNFTEQIILAELFAQQIEAHSAVRVERKLNLGGTFICQDALVSGKIDLYPEYTGTALMAVLKEPPQNNPAEVFRIVKDEYRNKFNVEEMAPLGFNNTFAMVIRGEDAENLHLRTVSDIAPYAQKWRAGFGYEFMERPDGYRGWVGAYGLHFAAAPRILDLGLLYRALADKKVDLVAGNSTDGVIASLHMVALEDDRHYFPPYEAVPLVRGATLEKHPEVRDAIGALAGKISVDEMRAMNYAVDGEQHDPADVVRVFRKSKGF